MKCLKQWDAWEPESAKEFVSQIIENLADEAGTDADRMNDAIAMLMFEGTYGPDTVDKSKMSLTEARDLVNKARQYRFSDVEFVHPEYPQDCECSELDDECTHTNYTISGDVIYNEVWSWYRAIYG